MNGRSHQKKVTLVHVRLVGGKGRMSSFFCARPERDERSGLKSYGGRSTGHGQART